MALAGDESAQLGHARAQALYGRYYANVYRYALSQLRSPEDAEDAAQNTFLRAFAALQKGVVPESEVAWIFKIAHNVCASSKLAWLRRRRVEAPRDLDLLGDAAVALPRPEIDAGEIGDALATMPPRLREAFLLREWQGLSYAEIAERLDTSRSAVETLIFRARRHLANELRRAQQALLVGPLGNWLRTFFGGGSGLARGAGLVAIAAAGVATAAVVAPAQRGGQPARTGPQPVRAGLVSRALPVAVAAAATSVTRARSAPANAFNTQGAGGSAAAPQSPGAPTAAAPTAPATGGAAAAPTSTAGLPTATVTAPTATLSPPTLPAVLTPPLSAPSTSVPPATLPTATVSSATVAAATTPLATTPALTTPALTTPSTLP